MLTRALGAGALLLTGLVATAMPAQAAGAPRPHAPAPPPGPATVNVLKQLGKSYPVWALHAEIIGDTGATFDGGGTTADATSGDASDPTAQVPALFHLNDVPSGGVDIRITEPRVASSGYNSAGCNYGDTTNFSSEDAVGFTFHVQQDVPQIEGPTLVTSCTLYNDQAQQVRVTKVLDPQDGGENPPAAGFHVVVLPVSDNTTVGEGDVFSSTGQFTTKADGPTVVNVFRPAADEFPAVVFVGEVMDGTTTFTHISCIVGEEVVTPSSFDLTHQVIDGHEVVGFDVAIPRWASAIDCEIDDVSNTLTATKTASIGTVAPSGSLEWTVTGTNGGATTLHDVAVIDDLPAGLTPTAVTPTPACTITGQHVACSFGDLAGGQSVVVKISVTADAGLADGSSIVNTGTVTASVPMWVCPPPPPSQVPSFAPACDIPQCPAVAVTCSQINTLAAAIPNITLQASAQASVNIAVPATTTTSTTTTTTTTAPTTTSTTSTTIVVEQAAPVTTTTIPASLPATGADLDLLPIAACATSAGAALLFVRRMRRPRRA